MAATVRHQITKPTQNNEVPVTAQEREGGKCTREVHGGDCLHLRSNTSSSKDVDRANALARGGLSSRSIAFPGSASELDEQCSWASRSDSTDSEADLSLRVRLAISLISMRERESECVAAMSGVGGTMAGAGVVRTLLTSGDLRGRSMLRPTRLHRGILNMCLHAASPGGGGGEEEKKDGMREE
ncbi:hypothetical protein EYF80_021611 [Liparis tanakae]|uniref:Uncharacterized protein n=1 Tax=Liparis tanakae TaxID=230148 RepID=A0A4Z2HQV5_9TELE|nr:hypothetical protein EYF80_021611 [Liparis tanakae]